MLAGRPCRRARPVRTPWTSSPGRPEDRARGSGRPRCRGPLAAPPGAPARMNVASALHNNVYKYTLLYIQTQAHPNAPRHAMGEGQGHKSARMLPWRQECTCHGTQAVTATMCSPAATARWQVPACAGCIRIFASEPRSPPWTNGASPPPAQCNSLAEVPAPDKAPPPASAASCGPLAPGCGAEGRGAADRPRGLVGTSGGAGAWRAGGTGAQPTGRAHDTAPSAASASPDRRACSIRTSITTLRAPSLMRPLL